MQNRLIFFLGVKSLKFHRDESIFKDFLGKKNKKQFFKDASSISMIVPVFKNNKTVFCLGPFFLNFIFPYSIALSIMGLSSTSFENKPAAIFFTNDQKTIQFPTKVKSSEDLSQINLFFCLREITKQAQAQKMPDFLQLSSVFACMKTVLNDKVKREKLYFFFH